MFPALRYEGCTGELVAKLKDILTWTAENGDPRVIDRLRLRIFPSLMRERLVLSQVDDSTRCSPALIEELRAACSELVGKPCPY